MEEDQSKINTTLSKPILFKQEPLHHLHWLSCYNYFIDCCNTTSIQKVSPILFKPIPHQNTFLWTIWALLELSMYSMMSLLQISHSFGLGHSEIPLFICTFWFLAMWGLMSYVLVHMIIHRGMRRLTCYMFEHDNDDEANEFYEIDEGCQVFKDVDVMVEDENVSLKMGGEKKIVLLYVKAWWKKYYNVPFVIAIGLWLYCTLALALISIEEPLIFHFVISIMVLGYYTSIFIFSKTKRELLSNCF